MSKRGSTGGPPAPRSPEARDRATTQATTRGEGETFALGHRLGASLRGGEIVSLEGQLGAGKTVFARGIAAGLGIDPREVGSPTFIIVDRHQGRLTLYHADLYRLDREDDVLDLGLDELAASGGAVMVVEWGERLPAALRDAAIIVRISDAASDSNAGTEAGLVPADETRRIEVRGAVHPPI